MAYFTVTIPASGFQQRFPSIPSASAFKLMTVAAHSTNSGPVFCAATGTLKPGTSVTMNVEDSGALHLSGAIGDGIGVSY